MDAIPSVTSSAQSLLQTGFATLNRAAAQFTPANADPSQAQANATPGYDPYIGGVMDVISAREDVSSGVLLLNTYNGMYQDLLHAADPNDPTTGYADRHPFDQYA